MKKIVIILSVLAITVSGYGQTIKKQAEIEDKTVSSLTNEEVLQTIHNIINTIGFVELPYTAYFDQEGAKKVNNKLGVVANGFFGVLPDTTLFYGVLYYQALSVGYTLLATFDKKGNLIDNKCLVEGNCYEMVGESLLCEEYTTINKDLTLHYYKSKHLWKSESGEYDALDCKHFDKKGKIDKVGKIIFEERKEIPVKNCEQYESFSLDSFPKEWVNLTMHENKYVIYQSCDAGNLLWRFSKNNSKYELLMYGTQEDYIFEIDRTYKINDTIFVESKWKDSKEIKNFKILWDKDKHLIQTEGNFDTWDLFVEEKNVSDYKVYIQPCRECWGDECDEIEKLNERKR